MLRKSIRPGFAGIFLTASFFFGKLIEVEKQV